MNYRIILSLVSALAICWGVLGSIAVSDHVGFGAAAAYAGEYDAPPHPLYLTVQGHALEMPYKRCANLIEQALIENRTVPVPDEKCRSLMLQALELNRSAPPQKVNTIRLPPAPPPFPGAPGAPGYVPPEETGAVTPGQEGPAPSIPAKPLK